MGIYTPNSPYPFAIRPQSPNPRIKRPEDATIARYGDLRYLLQNGVGGGAIVDITASEIYNKSVNNELVAGTKYRITDYKSVNWLNGYNAADQNNPSVVSNLFKTYAPVDTNIANGASGGSAVSVLANDAASISDGVFVGGDFTQIGSVSIGYLQKLNADGTPNAAFNTYYNPAALSPGFNGSVNAIAVQTDGKVIVGGCFTSLNSITRNYLVRFNVNGTVDTAFYTNLGTGISGGCVTSIAVQSDGKILVGGGFSTFNGNTRNGLVRLNPDGTEDTAFGTNLGTGALAGGVSKIFISQTGAPGKIYLVGAFANWNGAANTLDIVRLNVDGTRDSTFVGGFPAGHKGASFFYELSNGDILLSESTSWAGNPLTSQVYRVSSTGSLVNGAWGNVTTQIANVAVKTSDGGLIIAGFAPTDFDAVTGIAKYNEAGVRDVAYNPLASFDDAVYSLAIMDSEKYLFCGCSIITTYQGGTTTGLIPISLDSVAPFQARAVHVSDPEVLVVAAINGSELDSIGYSETYGDAVNYIPYFNAHGLVFDVFNGSTLPNSQIVSGFDLQWNAAGNYAYFTMPAGYPVQFGNYFYVEFDTPVESFYFIVEPVKPGLNYSMEIDTDPAVIWSSVEVSPDGYTVKLADVTFAQYFAYNADSLYVETIDKFNDAYGFIQWRKDYTYNVEAPFDWRNYRYRRYKVDPADISPNYSSFNSGRGYIGVSDVNPVTTTGEYIDVAPLTSGPSYATSPFTMDYYLITNNTVLKGLPGYISYYFYASSYDNFVMYYSYSSVYILADGIITDSTICDVNSSEFSNLLMRNTILGYTAYSSYSNVGMINAVFPYIFDSALRSTRFFTAAGPNYINNTSFSNLQVSIGDQSGSTALNSGHTKMVIQDTSNQSVIVEHDGTTFVTIPW